MSTGRRGVLLVVLAALLAACAPAGTDVVARPVAPASRSTTVAVAGADGVGDELYPQLGNGGYDVVHYDLALSPDHDSGVLTATATIDAVATAPLATFDLDLSGLTVDAVEVGGTGASWQRTGPELVVTPVTPIAAGSPFRVAVDYHGVPGDDTIPSLDVPLGWVRTTAGSYVVSEPDGAHTWFPSNDHPSDKATFTFHVSVPDGTVAVANGTLQSQVSGGGRTTWTWSAPEPMATYLAVVAVGDYELHDTPGPHGTRIVDAYLRADAATVAPCSATTTKVIDRFEPLFGSYPFATAGLLVADSPPGLAMEAQSRPLFSRTDFANGCPEEIIVHELVHQWFGDAVTPARWQDVWLNEGFATYGEWLWATDDDPAAMDRLADAARARLVRAGTTIPPIALPTEAALFGWQVYEGGAAVLQALRQDVGDAAFFTILRQWVATWSGRSATTEDFIALASAVAGRDLAPFLRSWLYDRAY